MCDTGSQNFHGRRRLDTANTANNTDSMGVIEKIKEIEAEMARTQKNKATEYHLGQLKAKLAKLRTELQEPAGKAGSSEQGFEVQKYGDGRVALIGFPSVGKSTLLNKLTGTDSEAAAYEFTTLTCVPGTIHMRGTKIQMLDLPGIIEGASEGKGRGRQVIAVCKSADLLLMVLDAGKPHYHKEILTKELESCGMRLNKKPPNVTYRKKKTGGLTVTSLVPQSVVDEKMVQRILSEYRVHNADVVLKEDISVDDLIDVIEGNRKYVKCLYVYNKIDVCSIEEVDEIARRPNSIPVSCYADLNLDDGSSYDLLHRIWDMMGLVRIYTKKTGNKPDFGDPVVLSEDRGGTTLKHFCKYIHRNMVEEFNYGLVWGTSSKHMPQRCGLSHRLHDEDVVQLVKKKVIGGSEARGRFRQGQKEYVRTVDRVKKAALKT